MLSTVSEVAEALRCCNATVYRMMADGRIPQDYYCKLDPGAGSSSGWRFNLDAIERHLLAQDCEPPKNP